MSTATFAWFSMNTTVSATGMQVEAKSNSTYLLIRETSSVSGETEAAKAASIQAVSPASTAVALTVTAENADVYPSKPYETTDATKYTNVATTATAVTTYDTANVAGNWFTANSNDPSTSATSINSDQVLTTFAEYVIKKSVTLTIAAGADSADTLTVTGSFLPSDATLVETENKTAVANKYYYSKVGEKYTLVSGIEVGTTVVTGYYESSKDISAVKVLVVTDDDNMVTLDHSSAANQSLHTTLDQTLTNTSVVVVDIYIYYDGSAASVTSNNKANLGNAQISLQFDVVVVE